MATDYWHKQTAGKPLFGDLLWSQPENRQTAGKLLILGGNAHGFAAPAEAYRRAELAGVGAVRVVLPDAIQRLVGGFFENAFFAFSTPSGSFSQAALAELLEQSAWADGVMFAGDFGRNSETAILLEKFAAKYAGQLTLTKDAVDYFITTPDMILRRPNTLLVVSMTQLQKLAVSAGQKQAITFDLPLMQLVERLREFTKIYPCHLIVKQFEQLVVAVDGKISTTRLQSNNEIWRVQTAANVVVWWLQNPGKPFEALTTAMLAGL